MYSVGVVGYLSSNRGSKNNLRLESLEEILGGSKLTSNPSKAHSKSGLQSFTIIMFLAITAFLDSCYLFAVTQNQFGLLLSLHEISCFNRPCPKIISLTELIGLFSK